MEEMRLQKFLAMCGIASRRQSEEIILSGRVKVNGVVIKTLGTKVKNGDEVQVDNKLLALEEKVYYALYKPTGYITTVSDELNRRTILDLILEEHKKERIFPIGRLDYDTSGIIILTNDGELSHILTSSKNGIEKEYLARVEGIVPKEVLKELSKGITLDTYTTKRAKVYLESIDKPNNSSLIRITITEGKYHEIRDMFEKVGYPVKKLKRVRFGVITLDKLKEGDYRRLTIHEVRQLYGIKKEE